MQDHVERGSQSTESSNVRYGRVVSDGELATLAKLGALFHKEAEYPGMFNPHAFCSMMRGLIDTNKVVVIGVWVDEELCGAIAALVTSDLWTLDNIAIELFWFVDPVYRGYGLPLLDRLEEAALALGVKRLIMVHLTALNPKIMHRLYTRRGYRCFESQYVRDL